MGSGEEAQEVEVRSEVGKPLLTIHMHADSKTSVFEEDQDRRPCLQTQSHTQV